MKTIAVLDGHTLTPLCPGERAPEHPDWGALEELGRLVVYPRSRPEEIIPRAAQAQIVLVNKVRLEAETIRALPDLAFIGVTATGTNVVDLAVARERGIPVSNVPGYGAASVAQHVFALALELAAHVGAFDAAVKAGEWARCPDFCFLVAPTFELADKSLGVVGFGAIGQAVARIGHGFGMKVLAHSRTRRESDVPVEWVEREEIFSRSDVLTLHCPLTPDTRHLVNHDSLARMKTSALLINTGRGDLVDEVALAAALRAGVLGGFGGDVLQVEPPSPDHPLYATPRTILTPHVAWATTESRRRLMDILVGNVRAFLAGAPRNVVNY